MTSIQVMSKNNSWITVQAECLPNEKYQIWELYDNDSLGEFKQLDSVESLLPGNFTLKKNRNQEGIKSQRTTKLFYDSIAFFRDYPF